MLKERIFCHEEKTVWNCRGLQKHPYPCKVHVPLGHLLSTGWKKRGDEAEEWKQWGIKLDWCLKSVNYHHFLVLLHRPKASSLPTPGDEVQWLRYRLHGAIASPLRTSVCTCVICTVVHGHTPMYTHHKDSMFQIVVKTDKILWFSVSLALPLFVCVEGGWCLRERVRVLDKRDGHFCQVKRKGLIESSH